jgi:hypothetical protein
MSNYHATFWSDSLSTNERRYTYKQKLKQELQVTRTIRKWSDDADAMLRYCFTSTDWNMFRDSSNGIEEYTTSVTGFINKCIDDVVPTVTVSSQ